MANYGTAFASFYNADLQLLYDLNGNLSTSSGTSYIEVLNARGNSSFMGVGYGEFYVPPGDIANSPLVAVGHYAIVYQQDQIGSYQGEIACFIIKDIHVEVLDAVPMLKISGPEVTHELTQYMRWQDVGDQAQDTSTINDTGAYAIGTKVFPMTALNVAKFSVGSSLTFVDFIIPVHYARVTDVDTTGGSESITIDPPLREAIADITDIVIIITDYSTPTTQDITRIMSGPVGDGTWALTVQGGGSGTTSGTSHRGGGVTILSLLNAAAQISGEWWRLKQRSAGNVAPLREIEWRSTSDSTGITLVMPTQSEMISRVTSTSYGIIESVKRQYRDERISHLIAYGGGSGDKRVTLYEATDTPPAGYTVTYNTTGYYTVLVDDSLETEFDPGKREAIVTFANIQPAGVTPEDIETAGNQLLAAAVNWMEARNEKRRFYEVECVIHKNIRPGQTIGLTYSDTWLTLTQGTLYIVEYEHYVGDDNVRRTRLLLSEDLSSYVTGNDILAQALATNSTLVSTLGVGAARASAGQSSVSANGETIFTGDIIMTGGSSVQAGNTILNDTGLEIQPTAFGDPPTTDEEIRFVHNGTLDVAGIDAYYAESGGSITYAEMRMYLTDKDNFIGMDSTLGARIESTEKITFTHGTASSDFVNVDEYLTVATGITVGSTDQAPSGTAIYVADGDGGILLGGNPFTDTPSNNGILADGDIQSRSSVIVDQGTADGEAVLLQSDDVTHGMTSVTSDTNTYYSESKYSATSGGVVMRGFTEASVGVAINGYVTTNATGTGTSAVGPVLIQGFLKSGTSTTALASGDNLAVFVNAGTSVAFVRGDGSIYSGGDVRATDGMAVGSITRNPGAGEIYFEIQGSAASAPGTGALTLYAYNGQLWVKNSAGTPHQLTSF